MFYLDIPTSDRRNRPATAKLQISRLGFVVEAPSFVFDVAVEEHADRMKEPAYGLGHYVVNMLWDSGSRRIDVEISASTEQSTRTL
jgi:hypothetical protein